MTQRGIALVKFPEPEPVGTVENAMASAPVLSIPIEALWFTDGYARYQINGGNWLPLSVNDFVRGETA